MERKRVARRRIIGALFTNRFFFFFLSLRVPLARRERNPRMRFVLADLLLLICTSMYGDLIFGSKNLTAILFQLRDVPSYHFHED